MRTYGQPLISAMPRQGTPLAAPSANRRQGGSSMKITISSAVGAAAAATIALAASAQTPAQSSAQSSSTAPDQQVTVVGCVQREADYRKAQDAGKGGVAGTGVGVGNEFVLVDATTGTSAKPAAGGATPSPAPAGATATSASSGSGAAYELTGTNEAQAEKFVGRRVEVTGRLKAAEPGAAGRPTGGPTAGSPPAGVDVASKDLKLRELDVTSVREATGGGACAAR